MFWSRCWTKGKNLLGFKITTQWYFFLNFSWLVDVAIVRLNYTLMFLLCTGLVWSLLWFCEGLWMLVVGRHEEIETDCEGGATPANAWLSPWPEITADQFVLPFYFPYESVRLMRLFPLTSLITNFIYRIRLRCMTASILLVRWSHCFRN